MIDTTKVDAMLRGYFKARYEWFQEVRSTNVSTMDMLGMRADIARMSTRAVAQLVSLSKPEALEALGEEHLKRHLEAVDGLLATMYVTYVCQLLPGMDWDSERVVQDVISQAAVAVTRKIKTKEHAIKFFSDSIACHLLGRATALTTTFEALQGLQTHFPDMKCFDWACGLREPVHYDWTPEGVAKEEELKREAERQRAMIPSLFEIIGGMALKSVQEGMLMPDADSETGSVPPNVTKH